ncbi:hypothetical protein MTO96_044756 [Rhipicephalus appendiculatus]
MCANSFTIAAVAIELLRPIQRERWAFQRNERWFEDTLPHLGDAHFRQSLRVTPATFSYLVNILTPVLERADTNMRPAVPVAKRIAIGLYRLRSTAEDATIAHLFGVGRSTAIGALDGCHIPVSPPEEHATDYFNYKGWYSMILLALVDHQYRFRYINVGSPGRCHDAFVYGRSDFRKLVESNFFKTPVSIIEGTTVAPIILCDQAFPLTANLQKPFANAVTGTRERMFNYQLSRTRRIVENAFGRLKARFRYTSKRMECKIKTAKQAIRAACVLHNICETLKDPVEHQWEQELHDFNMQYPQPAHSTDVSSGDGERVREALANYFFRQAQQQ